MSKSFLNTDEIEKAQKILKLKDSHQISKFLDECLLKKLSAHPLWERVRPIALGSWARNELCAKSDIDLILLGSDEDVMVFTENFMSEGLKIRYRVPESRQDWTVGVLPFDVLAIYGARSFFPSEQAAIDEQVCLIEKKGPSYKKSLFSAMLKERRERTVRYDSIANYLEPNLKFGSGGLRDLEQGLAILKLFEKKRSNFDPAARDILDSIKKNILLIRHWLHLNGYSDILVSGVQKELADWSGFASVQVFMSNCVSQLNDVSFYADWIAECYRRPTAYRQIMKIWGQSVLAGSQRNTISAEKALGILKDSKGSIFMQKLLRNSEVDLADKRATGQWLQKNFNVNMKDDFLKSLFRSKLIHVIVKPLKRLRGYVQHDQYHRYSVDAHTLQAVRGVLRIHSRPNRVGQLKKWVKVFDNKDWEVLLWTALFHDLGKGLEKDHSTEGAKIVLKFFKEFGLSDSLAVQVAWLVQNHLVLSHAAFRQNPLSSNTWTELFKRGVSGKNISRLAVFTAVDIIATNPDAWSGWKEQLLFDLTSALHSSAAGHLDAFIKKTATMKLRLDKDFMNGLDPKVVEKIAIQKLIKDYQGLKSTKGNLVPLVLTNRLRETWVRIHERVDQPGLFLKFAHQFHSLGLSVQEAFVYTHPKWGAYDWFRIKTKKSSVQIGRVFKKMAESPGLNKEVILESVPKNSFSTIELVSRDADLAVLSFRGRDHSGALLSAAKLIYEAGLEISYAKVHTWGKQIDDIFTVVVKEQDQKLNQLLENSKTQSS